MKKIEKNKQLQVKCKIGGLKKRGINFLRWKIIISFKERELVEDEAIVRRSKEFLMFTLEGDRGAPELGLCISGKCLKLSS